MFYKPSTKFNLSIQVHIFYIYIFNQDLPNLNVILKYIHCKHKILSSSSQKLNLHTNNIWEASEVIKPKKKI